MEVTRTAIITGASSGIGRHTAIALNAAGWNVVLTGRRKEQLQETQALCSDPSRCFVIPGELTNESFVEELFERTVATFGRVDLLFNNAGTNAPQIPIEEQSIETFKQVVDVNLVAPFLCTRQAFKYFKSQTPQGGRIINNGSLCAHVPRPHTYAYTCSKHAMLGLTKCTALDGRAYNISCTQIDIGNAMTDMAKGHLDGALQPDGRVIPEHVMDVKHVADTIVHIAGFPNDVQVLQTTIMALRAPYVGRG